MSALLAAISWTALRPSASVLTQYGTSERPGSGIVMPRPAVLNNAAPGIGSARTWSPTWPTSWPRLIAAATPK